MATMAGSLMLTWDERKEKVEELMAFLSAFGVSRADAQSIFSMAYQDIKKMSANDFIRKGEQMAMFVNAMQSRKPE